MSGKDAGNRKGAPTRRDMFKAGLAATAAAAVGGGMAVPATAATAKDDDLGVPKDGKYETVPLRRETTSLGVVQARVRAVDAANHKVGIKSNLNHMLDLIDAAQGYGAPNDILFFHEFPITGWSNKWTRKDILRFALEIPGEETEAIGKKAKQYNCYIVFGSYARDRDWPDHVLSITSIVDPTGAVIAKHWKARNIKGVFYGWELFTTTIYDVLDRYVEMYGIDEVLPVTRTDVGNIATTSTQREPELVRGMAMKGAEIILRTATGGFSRVDMQATSLHNGVYSAVANNAISPDNPGFFEDSGSGGSAIFGPDGEPLAEARSPMEQLVQTRIPMADFRKRHRIPTLHPALVLPVYQAYVPRYSPNLFAQYLPTDLQDSGRFHKDKANW